MVVMAAISSVTWQRAGVYRSPQTLWRDTILRNPDAWAAHNNLGDTLCAAGEFVEGIKHFQLSLGGNPDQPAGGREDHGLDQKLYGDVKLLRSQSAADADFAGALRDAG